MSLISKKTLKNLLFNEKHKRKIQAVIKLDEFWGQGAQIIYLKNHFHHNELQFFFFKNWDGHNIFSKLLLIKFSDIALYNVFFTELEILKIFKIHRSILKISIFVVIKYSQIYHYWRSYRYKSKLEWFIVPTMRKKGISIHISNNYQG